VLRVVGIKIDNIMTREQLLLTAIKAAIEAGKEIFTVYNTDFEVEQKADFSPLTEADKKAHNKIMELLAPTNLPVLSEEGKTIPYVERKNWRQFWMVDPLDGTKEFVKKNGEFTVNIALIENGKATLGVIYVPVTKELYFSNEKAYKCTVNHKEIETLEKLIASSLSLPLAHERNNYVVVASRSHMSVETEEFISQQKKTHQEVDLLSKGSSLKLCMVAEGSADSYPRFAPTMEWDTAAGQAIAEASECKVIDFTTQRELAYNKENLLNNWFLVER